MFVALPLGFSDTVEVTPAKGRVTGLESLGFHYTNGTETITRNDDGDVIKTESKSNFVKKNSDGSKETRTSTTEYNGELFVDGAPVKETTTTTKIGKNGKPTSSETKEYPYMKDDKGVSWRMKEDKVTKTDYENGKPKNQTVTDGWGHKLEDTKYDKNGVREENTTYAGDKVTSTTEYDTKGEPNRTDWMGKDGKTVIQTKDFGKDGAYTMSRYNEDDGSIHVETKFDKDGKATESTQHFRNGGKVKTSFKDGHMYKSVDYDKNGKATGVRYHDNEDIARETGDSTGIFRETGDSTGIFNVADDFFGDNLDVRDMQADVSTQVQEHHY